jgi:CHAD domain-containing protein
MKKSRYDWNPGMSAGDNARRNLPLWAAEFLKKGEKAASGKAPPEELHQFRLAAKRFRYTLEMFRSCYGPGLEKRLDVLRKLQNFLGDINDCIATRSLLTRKRACPVLHLETLLDSLDSRGAKRYSDFQDFWQANFRAHGRDRWWTGYLARFAR